MRGTPFLKEGFHLGLNTIDSPYTLAEGESRDCMNVVSSERGAIKKRTGASQFAYAYGLAPFPSLTVTDSFKRPAEKPLSNAGKWSLITGAENTGEIAGEAWDSEKVYPSVSGALWNVAEQSNPAVSVELVRIPSVEKRWFGVWCCLSKTAKSGYFVRYEETIPAGTGEGKITIEKWETGTKTVLATLENQLIEKGDSLGVTLKNEVIRAWQKHAGVWNQVLESPKDNKYTKGYTGIEASGTTTGLINFATGEYNTTPQTLESEITSLLPCLIGGVNYLIAVSGTKMYSVTEIGEVTEIGSGFTEGKRWSIIQAPSATEAGKPLQKVGGPVYLSNGVDKPQTWPGKAKNEAVKEWVGAEGEYEEPITKAKVTAYEDATSKKHVPNGKYMVFAGNRVWMAGMSDDQMAVRFSGQAVVAEGGGEADPTSWPKENVVRFDPEDGKPITGLGLVGPYILVFKERKCWVIHNLDTGENRKLSDKIGCVANRSIVETAVGTFFLTHDQGVYLTNGTTVKEMSYNVRPNLTEKANVEQLELAAGGFLNNHYYISYPAEGSSVNNRTLDYDVQLKSWWLHDLAANQWVQWELLSEAKLYIVRPKAKDGVLKAFVPGIYQDVGVNYTGNGKLGAYWLSPWEPFAYYIFRHRVKAPFLKKRIRMVFFDGSGSIIPVVYKNFKTTGVEEKATVGNTPETEPTKPVELTGTEEKTQAARIYAVGTARVISAGFGNNSNLPFEVDAYAYMIQFRKS